jgi:hypothetical protein
VTGDQRDSAARVLDEIRDAPLVNHAFRILVVDDDPSMRGLLPQILSPSGYAVSTAAVCDRPVDTGNSGSFRFFMANDSLGLAADGNTGTFYTGAQGKRLVRQGETAAVKRYVNPAACLSPLPGHLFDVNTWGGPSYSRLRARIGPTLGRSAAMGFVLGDH